MAATTNNLDTINTLTAKSAQLEAMLAIVMATPDALEALGDGHRMEFLGACYSVATEVRAAAESLSV